MNTKTILALSALLLPLMFGSMACDDSQMPASTCVPGPGKGPAGGITEAPGQWWIPTSSNPGVDGQWACNNDGGSTFTPGTASSQ